MPLYDYGCTECDNVMEVFHKMDDIVRHVCIDCKVPMQKLLTTGMVKRPDATWVADINGTINDLGEAQSGRQEYITTREQARDHIKKVYSDPHPNVQKLKTRYLERY
jgi:putative FmdB family regulatory protein